MPIALLALLSGATAAAAAVHASPSRTAMRATAPKPAPFLWHSLSLENGWKSASTKPAATGTPAWAVRDGVVYLRGAIRQASSAGTDIFAQLPPSARPARYLYLQVYTNADAPGTLLITPGGALEAYAGNSLALTSLAGVSYLATTVKTSALSLENGWKSSQPVYDTGNPAYSVSNGVVYLSGSMETDGRSELAFVLPRAARPAAGMYISVYTDDSTTGSLHIQSTGQVYASGLDAGFYTELAGISFPAAKTTWHQLALRNGWKSASGLFHTAPPSYAIVNGVVYLTGAMHQPGSGSGVWTMLPAAARTTGDALDLEVGTSGETAGGVGLTNSRATVTSVPAANARAFTSLAGIAYPPTS